MAIRRCAWCGTTAGLRPEIGGPESPPICAGCEATLAAEAALVHVLLVLRTAATEVERAIATLEVPRGPRPPSLSEEP